MKNFKCDGCKEVVTNKNDLSIGYGVVLRVYHKKCLEEYNRGTSKFMPIIPMINFNNLNHVKKKILLQLSYASIILVILLAFVGSIFFYMNKNMYKKFQ